MERKPYPTDLTDAQWAISEPLLTPHRPRGPRRKPSLRQVANALLYLLRTGCPWRALPHDLPSWMTVWWYFRKWRNDGTLAWIVRNRRLRCDYEATVKSATAYTLLAMIAPMVQRLGKDK